MKQPIRKYYNFFQVVRISVSKLCSLILRRLERISDDINLLNIVVFRGLNDPCWEIRDTVLEVLREILPILYIAGSLHCFNDQVLSMYIVASLKFFQIENLFLVTMKFPSHY